MAEEKISFDLYHPHPLLIVISGPTAVGKDAVIKLMFERKFPIHFVVTATNRPRRPTEIEGVDYFFVSTDRFQEMIANNELIEYSWVYNAYKGIPRNQVVEAFASGKDVILRIDTQGAQKIRKIYPESVQIFLLPRTEEELKERIKKRGTEDERQMEERLATARQELKCISDFDYIVVNENDHLDRTIQTIESIIDAEHHRVHQRKINL
jgi:guanylate kinase